MSIQREQIIRCACDLYLSEGFEGFSMRKLAKCVGCTAPALYRHYENKEEVMQEVVAEAFRLFAQYLYRALEGRTPQDRFLMAETPEHVISIRGLVNRFGTQVVHDGLNLDVRRDECLAVVGGSGTGKSVSWEFGVEREIPQIKRVRWVNSGPIG